MLLAYSIGANPLLPPISYLVSPISYLPTLAARSPFPREPRPLHLPAVRAGGQLPLRFGLALLNVPARCGPMRGRRSPGHRRQHRSGLAAIRARQSRCPARFPKARRRHTSALSHPRRVSERRQERVRRERGNSYRGQCARRAPAVIGMGRFQFCGQRGNGRRGGCAQFAQRRCRHARKQPRFWYAARQAERANGCPHRP